MVLEASGGCCESIIHGLGSPGGCCGDLRKTSDLESNLEDKTAVCEQTEQTYKQSIDMMNEKEQPEPVDSDRKTIQ